MKHWIFFKRFLILIVLFILFDFLISIVLINGLNNYFGFSENPEILINGSSMAMSGFNRKDIENYTGMKIASYNHEGVSIIDRYAMIRHFFQMYPEGVKTVVYEVNPVLFSNIKTAENIYTIFYPYMDDKTIDKYIKERTSIKEYYINKIIRAKRFDSRLIRLIIMGYLGKSDNLKTNTLDTATLLPLITKKGMIEIAFEKMNEELFEKTMDIISSNHANIILVMMPMYHIKLNTFRKEDYNKLCKYFKDYCSARKDIEFLDLNQDSLIYNPNYFSDPLHFNVYGQRQITHMICSHLIKN